MKLNLLIFLFLIMVGLFFISGCQPNVNPEIKEGCTSDSCISSEFISCEQQQNGIYIGINKGKVVGKCEVECLSNDDCLSNQECVDSKCQIIEESIIQGPGFNRDTPLSLNTLGEITMGYEWSQLANIKITISGIKRGSSAWSMIEEANMFNDEPPSGKEYLLTKIKVEVISTSDNNAYDLSSYNFDAVSSSGIVYDKTYVVEPEPSFGGEIYSGGMKEGWKTFEVNVGDTTPLLRVSGANDKDLWFKLY
ncbi:MAG: hypothetical protein ABIH25_00275 [Candidatus Woesearchaeota archaeon]